MRKTLIALTILAAVAGTAVVWAAGDRSGRVDSQTYAWTTDAATIGPGDWSAIPDLSVGTRACHGNRKSSATLSLQLADASSPVEVRVAAVDPLCPGCEPSLLHPGAVTVEPGSASFTFVGRAVGDHGTSFVPEWRLPDDAGPNDEATLEGATLHVLWKRLRGTCA